MHRLPAGYEDKIFVFFQTEKSPLQLSNGRIFLPGLITIAKPAFQILNHVLSCRFF